MDYDALLQNATAAVLQRSLPADLRLNADMVKYVTFKYDAHLEAWGEALAADIQTRRLALPADSRVSRVHEPYVWWGSRGAVTPMHYDNYANMYLQVREGWEAVGKQSHAGMCSL